MSDLSLAATVVAQSNASFVRGILKDMNANDAEVMSVDASVVHGRMGDEFLFRGVPAGTYKFVCDVYDEHSNRIQQDAYVQYPVYVGGTTNFNVTQTATAEG